MNKRRIIGVVIVFMAVISLTAIFRGGPSSAGTGWETDIHWSDPAISNHQITAGGKPVYLFISTEWCTFCRKMKAETFTDKRVQENLNNYFVSIHMNPETEGVARFTGEEYSYAELARQLGVTGFPVSFFFNADGELIGGQPGYLSAEQLADLSEYIGGGYYKDYKFGEFMDLSPDQRLK